MKRLSLFITMFVAFSSTWAANDLQTITFPSRDGVPVTADVYMKHPATAPFIILFHRAQWSRGEYREIASQLNKLGYNCMAVDLRSGGPTEGVDNETAKRAEKDGKGTTYIDTLPDMESATAYARKHYTRGKLAIWGSSYSASLVLKLAGDDAHYADAVLAFAPGEYFEKSGKPATWVAASARNIKIPVFITSAANEKNAWQGIFEAIPSGQKQSYLPDAGGQHGSRALWSRYPESAGYWTAVEKFLADNLR